MFTELTRPERTPASVRCPFCLNMRGFTKDGQFRKHDDTGEKCRASGLSRTAAMLAFAGIMAGRSVEWLLSELQQQRKVEMTPENSVQVVMPAEVTPWNSFAIELGQMRIASEMSLRKLAEWLEVSYNALRHYEDGVVCPPLFLFIKWAEFFRMRLYLSSPSQRVPITGWSDWPQALIRARIEQKMSYVQIGEHLPGGSGNGGCAIHAREKGAAQKMRLAAAIEWAAVLGYKTEMEEQ